MIANWEVTLTRRMADLHHSSHCSLQVGGTSCTFLLLEFFVEEVQLNLQKDVSCDTALTATKLSEA